MRIAILILLALIAGIFAMSLTSCTTTRTTATDGTVTETRAADPLAVGLAGQALNTYVAVKAAGRGSEGKEVKP